MVVLQSGAMIEGAVTVIDSEHVTYKKSPCTNMGLSRYDQY